MSDFCIQCTGYESQIRQLKERNAELETLLLPTAYEDQLERQVALLSEALQRLDIAEFVDLQLKHEELRGLKPMIHFALYGCCPGEDVCIVHDEFLICKHCCSSGDFHACSEFTNALNEAGNAEAHQILYGREDAEAKQRRDDDDDAAKTIVVQSENECRHLEAPRRISDREKIARLEATERDFAALYASQNDRIDRLMRDRAALLGACRAAEVHLRLLIDGSVDCGDPGVECPLQDCGKSWSTTGIAQALLAAIKQAEESQ